MRACVVLFLCVSFAVGENTYRAAYVSDYNREYELQSYPRFIQEAAESKVDILVLPATQSENSFRIPVNYNEAVKIISSAAKAHGVYVAVSLLEKIRCQSRSELFRSSLVFDREGAVVALYRKPYNTVANCTTLNEEVPTFSTDFGVKFALYMDEDLVVQNLDVKNVVLVGGSVEIPFLSAAQFSSPWAYTTDSNLVSSSGIFSGKSGPQGAGKQLIIADLNKDGGAGSHNIPNTISNLDWNDNWSQYTIKPVDLEASMRGYEDTVCHGEFCCHFSLKTSFIGSNTHEVSYGLAAFDGVRHLGGVHHIGSQICSVFACAGVHKRSCDVGSKTNGTDTHFERITIHSSFASDAYFPILSSIDSSPETFKFDTSNTKVTEEVTKVTPQVTKVTAEVTKAQNLLSFGIFGRIYHRDFESFAANNSVFTEDIYDFLYNEDVQEFFDYLWIRLRILIFVVSIYILEML